MHSRSSATSIYRFSTTHEKSGKLLSIDLEILAALTVSLQNKLFRKNGRYKEVLTRKTQQQQQQQQTNNREEEMKSRARYALFGAFCMVALSLVFQFDSEGQRQLAPGGKVADAHVQQKVRVATTTMARGESLSFSKDTSEAAHLRVPMQQRPEEESQHNTSVNHDGLLDQNGAPSIGSYQNKDNHVENSSDEEGIEDATAEEYYDGGDGREDVQYIDNAGVDDDNNNSSNNSRGSVASNQFIDGAHVVVNAALSNYPRNHFLNNIVTITQTAKGDNTSLPEAVCRFSLNGNYLHFPHMMQSFTRCFSFFRRNADRAPVIVKPRHPRFREDFNGGMLDIFRDVFNGTVVQLHRYKDKLYRKAVIAEPVFEVGVQQESDRQGIAFQNPKHAQTLRQKTAAYYQMETEGCKVGKEKPVIGILNRNSTRTLLNAHVLHEKLSNFSDKPVEIVYFEGKSFHEQISFMMQTDIIVSPHGAQLSSINFMQECGGVFELFARGYFWPHFFGPLAATSGLFHGYVYTGKDLEEEWYQRGAQDLLTRRKDRKADIRAPIETSLEVILKLIDNWKSCCRERLAGGPVTLAST